MRGFVGGNREVGVWGWWGGVGFRNEHRGEPPTGSAIDEQTQEEGLETGGGAGVEAGDRDANEGDEVVMEMEFKMVSNGYSDEKNNHNHGEVEYQVFFKQSTFPDIIDLWENKDGANSEGCTQRRNHSDN